MFEDPKDDETLSMKVGDFKKLVARETRLVKLLRRVSKKIGEDSLGDEAFYDIWFDIRKELKNDGREP